MHVINEVIESSEKIDETLTLPFEVRQKSRIKVKLDNGEPVTLILPRGGILRHGNLLRAESGLVVKIIAAQESVSAVYSDDKILLMKACYHLGNRHVPVQVSNEYLCYQKDHVLDDMLLGLGLKVLHEHSSFEPESGAYAH